MSCPSEEQIAAMLCHDLSVNHVAEMERHFIGCESCQRKTNRLKLAAQHLRGATLVQRDDRFRDEVLRRIERPSAKTRSLSWPERGFALAAGLALVLLVPTLQRADLPVARGSGETGLARKLGIEVFLHSGSSSQPSRAVQPGERLSRTDGFSFVAHNWTGLPMELLVFGQDAAGQIHWFYPRFETSTDEPVSVRLSPHPPTRTLPEGVRPDSPAAGKFRIVAVFNRQPLAVKRLDQRLSSDGLKALSEAAPSSVIQELEIELEP